MFIPVNKCYQNSNKKELLYYLSPVSNGLPSGWLLRLYKSCIRQSPRCNFYMLQNLEFLPAKVRGLAGSESRINRFNCNVIPVIAGMILVNVHTFKVQLT